MNVDIEYAAMAQGEHRAAALRNAPAWVRRRLGVPSSPTPPPAGARDDSFVRGYDLADGTRLICIGGEAHHKAALAEHRSGKHPRTAAVIRGSQPSTRGGSGVSRDTRPPTAARKVITRVLMVFSHGIATPRSTGKPHAVEFSRTAYGTAEALNAERAFAVNVGHGGEFLEVAGPKLRIHSHDEVGYVAEWIVDDSNPAHRAAVEKVKRGWQVSAGYAAEETCRSFPNRRDEFVVRAYLRELSIVDEGAMSGAVARVFRAWENDPEELRKQMDEVARASRWQHNKSIGRMNF